MEWLYIENKEELQKYANEKYDKKPFDKLRKEIKDDLKNYINNIDKEIKLKENFISITASRWDKLFEKIYLLREMINQLGVKNRDEEVEVKENEEATRIVEKVKEKPSNEILNNDGDESEYFKSKSDELIFYILELNGKNRNQKLGVMNEFYKDKVAAEKWRRNILLKIHPDICNNSKASEAVIKFEQLCELIIG